MTIGSSAADLDSGTPYPAFHGEPRRAKGPVGIVVSRYNHAITTNLLAGARSTLVEQGLSDREVTVAWVPGAWEVPLVAQKLAESGEFRAVICLAAVIQGETTHDQYINQQVSRSLGELALRTGIPILFGILTCQTLEQAIHRSGGRFGNKGQECAIAALEMIDLLDQLENRSAGQRTDQV
jgi:6,7-dimethyl-8-ribityllumazine synthase